MTEIRLVPPPHDGLAEAFRTAAARRRKKAATTGGAGLTAAALVFVALTGGTNQVLTQEPAPPAQQVPRVLELVPAPDDDARNADLNGERPDRQEPRSDTPGQTDPAPSVDGPRTDPQVPGQPSTQVRGPAVQPPAQAPQSATRGYRTGKMTRQDAIRTIPNEVGCIVESNAREGRLCSQVLLSTTGDPSTREIELYLCNSTTEDKDLVFSERNEVDLVVQVGNETVWRWSVDHADAAEPHTLTVLSASCTIWSTPYPTVNQDGTPLSKGIYTLRGTVDSAGAGLAATAVTTFQID